MDFAERILALIEEDINPALEQHAGSLSLVDAFWAEDVYMIIVEYSGTCTSCSSIGSTMNFVKNYLDEELSLGGQIEVITLEDYHELLEALEAMGIREIEQ
jgi:Fe-S cluster biogenesis protein NfuA